MLNFREMAMKLAIREQVRFAKNFNKVLFPEKRNNKMGLRVQRTISLSVEENKLVERIKNKTKYKLIDVFRRGMNEILVEIKRINIA